MDRFAVEERASARLLYDDAAPRLRAPVNPAVLKLRRPAFLFLPVMLLLAAAVPAAASVLLIGDVLPWPRDVVGLGLGGFLLLSLAAALLLAQREEKSFALLLPNLLSVVHALLAVAFGAGFVLGGPMGEPRVAGILAVFPGPPLEEFGLLLARAYCFVFVLVTAAGIMAAVLFRMLGLRRARADEERLAF